MRICLLRHEMYTTCGQNQAKRTQRPSPIQASLTVSSTGQAVEGGTFMVFDVNNLLSNHYKSVIVTRLDYNRHAIDREVAQYLSPRQSTAFSYCLQVHGACNKFRLNHQLPTITWASDDSRPCGSAAAVSLTLGSLKDFLRELYGDAERFLGDCASGLTFRLTSPAICGTSTVKRSPGITSYLNP
ncbi:hypothetical protein V1525DRAFT_411813 [Lipomyces kononenkoae]|uniref:Uncharacterized protein n=1 Tax=Lipomyces kononenkoae TaxID=34357 RepID=A0ACC3STA4_LIPKO